VVITSSESGQRLLVTVWFYCVSGFEEEQINASYTDGQQSHGFASSVVNCGTTRVPMGLPMYKVSHTVCVAIFVCLFVDSLWYVTHGSVVIINDVNRSFQETATNAPQPDQNTDGEI
jgi:hypothetical protein